jgi:hypothetical protein
MKVYFLLIGIFAGIFSGIAQLSTGDLAFVGFCADGDDQIAFVTFKEIPAKTKILFCDSEWDGSSFGTDENDLIWVSGNRPIAAGTVITVKRLDNHPICNHGIMIGETGLSKESDALFMYIGKDLRKPDIFISAISNSRSGFGSIKGTGLEIGNTAILLKESADMAMYIGPRSGLSREHYFTYLNNPEYWLIKDSESEEYNDNIAPGMSFNTCAFSFSLNNSQTSSIDASFNMIQ